VGLDQVATETFEVPVWERGELTAEVIGRSGWQLHALAHGFAPAFCDIPCELVDAGHGMPDDYQRLGEQTKGKVVLCDEGAPAGKRTPHRTEKLKWALDHGAAGLLIGSSAPGCLPRTGVCHATGSPIPSLGISNEDMLRLRRLLEDGMASTLRIHMRNTVFIGRARNVVAEIPATNADAGFVLTGAHLDSWDVSQGATDNGLGCAIVLQAAAALARCGRRPRRTIRFCFWAAEETGLRGSKHYVSQHQEELERIAAVMNFDMTGDPYAFWTPGRPAGHPLLRDLASALGTIGMTTDVQSSPSLHSDHQPFMLAGVPVVGLAARLAEGGGGHFYHSAGDTFEKVSIPALCRAAVVAAHALWLLANAPEPLFKRMSAEEVTEMIDEAGLREAVEAEQDPGNVPDSSGRITAVYGHK